MDHKGEDQAELRIARGVTTCCVPSRGVRPARATDQGWEPVAVVRGSDEAEFNAERRGEVASPSVGLAAALDKYENAPHSGATVLPGRVPEEGVT